MSKTRLAPFDLLWEGQNVRNQQKGDVDPVAEARDLVSQTILANVLLALSDCDFYEYLRMHDKFETRSAADTLEVDATTLEHLLSYLKGCGLFEYQEGAFVATEKGKRFFNSYTRGALNIYIGAYKEVLTRLPQVLSKQMSLSDPSLDRSTRHAAAGTAWLACAHLIPRVVEILGQHDVKTVLDLGCGTGDFLIQVARTSKAIKGIGVDMSEAALKQAEDNTHAFELDGRLRYGLAEVGKDPLPLSQDEIEKVDLITSMYMVHEIGREGRGAIVKLFEALQKQFRGKKLMLIEVEDFDPLAETATEQSALVNFSRLDYRLIHYLSRQGMPRSKKDWHGIFEQANCQIVDPGIKAGNSYIYIIRL